MDDSFFKVVIRDAQWDIRTEAKRLGFLFQLFVDHKKPTEVFIKYKSSKDAQRARASLAANENVVRVESMEKWDIRPKKATDNKENASTSGMTAAPIEHNGPIVNAPLMSEPMPLMMGMFNMCCCCRKGGASFQCFVCGTFYCGEVCQRNDWPSHIVQCLPRLVRVQSCYVPMEPPTLMPPYGNILSNNQNNNSNFNTGPVKADRKLQVPNQPMVKKENGPPKQQSPNKRPPSANPSVQKPVEKAPTNVTPSCDIPTNVIKNMALQRQQETQETFMAKMAAAASDKSQPGKTDATKNVATKEAPAGSKLVKRVQQKMIPVPKREICYGAFPQEGECVKISYFTNNMLYVYRSGQEKNGQPNRYLDFVKRSVDCARGVKQMLQAAPKVADVVFAPFDGDFYRAMVKSIEGTRVSVFFPDFGNTQTVNWNEMKEIPDKEIQYGMCYTHGVLIDGVPTFTRLVQEFLSVLLEMDDFEVTKVRDETPVKTIDLRHPRELYQLSAKLVEIVKKEQEMAKVAEEKPAVNEKPAATVPIVDPASYVPVTAEDFTELDLPMDKVVALMIVDSSELNISNQISVILTSEQEAYAKVVSDCERYGCNDPNPYNPESEHEAFLLHFDGVWCRAMLAAKNEELQYYLLDLGIIRSLNGGEPNCRRYPAGMTRTIFVGECFVDNPDALKMKTKDDEELLGMTLKATLSLLEDGDGEAMRITIHSID